MTMTEKEKIECNVATVCYSRNENFNGIKIFRKVKDHCYYRGKYRGAAHSICNLKYKKHRYIP